jgi:hypothetical protein
VEFKAVVGGSFVIFAGEVFVAVLVEKNEKRRRRENIGTVPVPFLHYHFFF